MGELGQAPSMIILFWGGRGGDWRGKLTLTLATICMAEMGFKFKHNLIDKIRQDTLVLCYLVIASFTQSFCFTVKCHTHPNFIDQSWTVVVVMMVVV